MNKEPKKAVVVGAGPSGISAAYELSKQNIETQIIEKSFDHSQFASS